MLLPLTTWMFPAWLPKVIPSLAKPAQDAAPCAKQRWRNVRVEQGGRGVHPTLHRDVGSRGRRSPAQQTPTASGDVLAGSSSQHSTSVRPSRETGASREPKPKTTVFPKDTRALGAVWARSGPTFFCGPSWRCCFKVLGCLP